MNNPTIIIEKSFNAPISKVWKALTDKNEMKKWYFDLKEFKAEPGFKFQFTGCTEDNTEYVHHCEVTEVVAGRKLTYSWLYEGYPGISYVTFELFEKGDETLLKLTHSGLESFGNKNPDFANEKFVEGWTQIINVSLLNYLEPKAK